MPKIAYDIFIYSNFFYIIKNQSVKANLRFRRSRVKRHCRSQGIQGRRMLNSAGFYEERENKEVINDLHYIKNNTQPEDTKRIFFFAIFLVSHKEFSSLFYSQFFGSVEKSYDKNQGRMIRVKIKSKRAEK